MYEVLNLAINVVVLFAWGFLVWGMIKDKKARKLENAKDRNFLVKTFWILFFGSILWFVVGLIDAFSSRPFLLAAFLMFLLGRQAYILNKDIRALQKK